MSAALEHTLQDLDSDMPYFITGPAFPCFKPSLGRAYLLANRQHMILMRLPSAMLHVKHCNIYALQHGVSASQRLQLHHVW